MRKNESYPFTLGFTGINILCYTCVTDMIVVEGR